MSGHYTIDPYYDSEDWRVLRFKVLKRDNHICQYCNGVARQADHIVPRRKGGKDTLRNLVACCATCNKTAGGRQFKSFDAKKKWILKNRLVDEERPFIPYVPKKQYEVRQPPKRSRLRDKLAAKNRPQYYVEEKLLE